MVFPVSFLLQRTVFRTLVPVCLPFFLLTGCCSASPPVVNDSAATPAVMSPAERTYTPVYAARAEQLSAREKRGTLKGDFVWAADATTLEMAAARWEELLKIHRPVQGASSPDQEYEDAFQANHISAAQYELIRVYYLLGRVEDGDRLLRELDPLDLVD